MYLTEFLTIALAHLFAVASPGPDFALVLRQTISQGREAGFWTSAGIATGILVHVSYCILGVAVLLAGSEPLFNTMKIVAAVYLFYLGAGALLSSMNSDPVPVAPGGRQGIAPRQLFVSGFVTNGLNPKATLFFLALFTVVVGPATPLVVQVIYGIYLAVATFCWFAALSVVLGHEIVRRQVAKSGHWFERGMGVVLIALALQLAFSMLGS